MPNPREDHPSEVVSLARGGEPAQLWELLDAYRPRLRRMVDMRMHPRLRGRVDASDVIQDSLLEVSTRLGDYLERCEMPFFLWVRLLTGQKLMQLHRRHLDTHKRDARREVRFFESGTPAAQSAVVARALLDRQGTPSEVVSKEEATHQLSDALESMPDIDREILVLRHFEGLKNSEVATLLEIKESTASQRHLRALTRLGEALRSISEYSAA